VFFFEREKEGKSKLFLYGKTVKREMRGAIKVIFARERCEKGNEKADQSHFCVEKDV